MGKFLQLNLEKCAAIREGLPDGQACEAIEKSGDFSRLAEMHAASSGLKSLCTTLAADGIETCRRAMGGHGFGGGSGMIALALPKTLLFVSF